VTDKIKMVRRQRGPIEVWLPEDCIGDTFVIDRADGMTDQEYVEMLEHWQMVVGDLCVIEGEM
jgi:hypothetical protein